MLNIEETFLKLKWFKGSQILKTSGCNRVKVVTSSYASYRREIIEIYVRYKTN